MSEEWEILNDEQGMWDLVEPDKSPSHSPNSIASWETVDVEVKLSETLDLGMKAIDKVHSEMPALNITGNVQMNQSKFDDAVKPLDAILDFKAKKESIDAGTKPLDKRDEKMRPKTNDSVKLRQSKEPAGVVKLLEGEKKTVDKELAALPLMPPV